MIYLDRVTSRLTARLTAKFGSNVPFLLNSYNIHRFFLASLVVATKFSCDVHRKNSHFSYFGGLRLDELNMLEIEFLQLIDFKLVVTPDEFRLTKSRLEAFNMAVTAAAEKDEEDLDCTDEEVSIERIPQSSGKKTAFQRASTKEAKFE